MKNIGVLLASIVLFSGIAFANPQQAKTERKDIKTDKKEVKKVPSKKKADKKDAKTTK